MKKGYLSIVLSVIVMAACNETPNEPDKPTGSRPEYVLVIHGGAGAMKRDLMSPEMEEAYRKALREALDKGVGILSTGGSSMETVEAVVRFLEDSPLFNAGKGAVLTHDAKAELDASIMDGSTLAAGSVAGVKIIKNPITAARMVMEKTEHVMLSGSGADSFGVHMGLEIVDNSYFYTPERIESLKKAQSNPQAFLQSANPIENKWGTVGAVALDRDGNLAAATSTGGMTNKRWGRIGDAPIIGAGTYADNKTCAVSCTGHGEYFIRNAVAYSLSAHMALAGESLKEAADKIIYNILPAQQGTGGLIAVDKNGNIAMPFNTDGMFRGFMKADGSSEIEIYKD